MLRGDFRWSRGKYSLRNSLAGGFNLLLRSVFSMFFGFDSKSFGPMTEAEFFISRHCTRSKVSH